MQGMGGITKLILLMTLAAVSFIPQDGIEALRCYVKSPDKDDRKTVTCPPDTPNVAQFCATFKPRINGTLKVGMRCYEANIFFHRLFKKNEEACLSFFEQNNTTVPPIKSCHKDGCIEEFAKNDTVPTKYCVCNKIQCNGKTSTSASDRPHDQSSVLSLCVLPISLAISFFGKP